MYAYILVLLFPQKFLLKVLDPWGCTFLSWHYFEIIKRVVLCVMMSFCDKIHKSMYIFNTQGGSKKNIFIVNFTGKHGCLFISYNSLQNIIPWGDFDKIFMYFKNVSIIYYSKIGIARIFVLICKSESCESCTRFYR